MQENGKKAFELEVCIDSVESGIAAERGGADRIELCGSLGIGGITPGLGSSEQVRRQVTLPPFVMLGPRFSDFCYSEEEYLALQTETERLAAAGADGFVLGILKSDGSLDRERIAALMEYYGGKPVTLHRYFDPCKDPFDVLRMAEEFDTVRILTSGQANTAAEGREQLVTSQQEAKTVRLMAGAGVSAENIPAPYRATGILSYHMSGKETVDSPTVYRQEGVSMGLSGFSEYSRNVTSAVKVVRAREVLDKIERESCPSDWRPSHETETETQAVLPVRARTSTAFRRGYRELLAMAGPMTAGGRAVLCYLYAMLPETDLCGYDFSPETLLSFFHPALVLYRERVEMRALPESYFLQYVLLPRVNNEGLRPVREKLTACIAARLRENGEEAPTGTALARAVNYAYATEGSYVSSDGRTISAAGFLESGQGHYGERSVFYANTLRAVSIPARQVYAPWQAHYEDSHAWVEYWVDGTWHFVGACEPDELDDTGWLVVAAGRATLVYSHFYPLLPGGKAALDAVALRNKECIGECNGLLYLNQLSRYADAVKLRIQTDTAERVTLYLLNSAGLRIIATFVPGPGREKELSLGQGSVYLRFQGKQGMRATMPDLWSGSQYIVESECETEVAEQAFRFLAPNGIRTVPRQIVEEQTLGREKYARCDEKLQAKRAARRDRTAAFLRRAVTPEERMYRRAFLASLSEKDMTDVREELLESEYQATMRHRKRASIAAFLEGILPERFGFEPLTALRGESTATAPGAARRSLTKGSRSEVEMLTALRTFHGSGITVKRREEDGVPLYFEDGAFHPFCAEDVARNVLLLRKGDAELRYEQHWTLYGNGKELDLEKRVWEEDCLTLRLSDGDYELFTEKRLPNGNACGERVAFTLAGGAEKELTLSFPEVHAEELLGDIRLPAVGGIGNESPLAMEFLFAPGEKPSEHIANEVLTERDALRALCAEKKLPLRFFLKGGVAAERGSCKALKQIFPETFYRLADFDAYGETLARKLFLEPGQPPLSILGRDRESAVFSAAGYRVRLIDLMLELHLVGEKGASPL